MLLRDISEGFIMSGSIDMASISFGVSDGFWCECDWRECVAVEDFRELSSANLLMLSRRLSIINAITRTMTRRITAPPMIPPSWDFVRPPPDEEELVAFVLGISAATGAVSLGRTPVCLEANPAVGTSGEMVDITVVIRV